MQKYSIAISSQCLKREISINAIVPDFPTGKWMLLLHGFGSDKDQWLVKTNVAEIANKHGITLILPSCGDGYYEDTQEPMGCFLGEELPEFVCKRFSLSRSREDTYICGASMGGFGALLIGSRYSNVYGKIASFGGAFIVHDVSIGNQGVLGNADVNYFRRVFGDFATLEGSERDPLTHVQKAVQANCMGDIWLACGTNDVLYRSNKRMYESLKRMGVSVDFLSVPGAHSWFAWVPYLKEMMDWFVNLPQ